MHSPLMYKLYVLIFSVFTASVAYANVNEAVTRQLTQAEYNAQIKAYTEQINSTKAILDDPASTATGQQQNQAFCLRLNAYRQILEISQQNLALEMANLMQVASQHYLQQQLQSMQSSGLNESAFCSSPAK
ncbi:hypothetical protein M5F03_01715 [Acinetobacter sp. ANC 5579]|uniref:hypothetical protein n=1 Tax=Acinetobacter amyesii TaxID=2942470 RepID=UPI0020BECCC5|nr:hypothetical protein [Acinetobacter amyesii]MCL6233892.1 hypothetical protein [Acinetobacter amyesii]